MQCRPRCMDVAYTTFIHTYSLLLILAFSQFAFSSSSNGISANFSSSVSTEDSGDLVHTLSSRYPAVSCQLSVDRKVDWCCFFYAGIQLLDYCVGKYKYNHSSTYP